MNINMSPNFNRLIARITAAYVTKNVIQPDKIAAVVRAVGLGLSELDKPLAPRVEQALPAVPVKKSITHDYLVCLEDGLSFKSLKRHLRAKFDMSPEQYRQKWKLPSDYPMVAPAYAAVRSAVALDSRLGHATHKRGRKLLR